MAEALIFDEDGVLIDTEPISMKATKRAIQEVYGYDVDPLVFHEFQGEGIAEYLAGGLAKYGVHLDDLSQLIARRTQIMEELMREGGLHLFPGVVSLLHKVKYSALKMGIATSSRREKLVEACKDAALDLSIFDAVLTGDDVARHKPDPEIYEQAAKGLDVSASHCLVIEDSVLGVQAAKSAGMLCVAVLNSFPERELAAAGADMIIESLETLSIEDIRLL